MTMLARPTLPSGGPSAIVTTEKVVANRVS